MTRKFRNIARIFHGGFQILIFPDSENGFNNTDMGAAGHTPPPP
jgi:hypothetical protein